MSHIKILVFVLIYANITYASSSDSQSEESPHRPCPLYCTNGPTFNPSAITSIPTINPITFIPTLNPSTSIPTSIPTMKPSAITSIPTIHPSYPTGVPTSNPLVCNAPGSLQQPCINAVETLTITSGTITKYCFTLTTWTLYLLANNEERLHFRLKLGNSEEEDIFTLGGTNSASSQYRKGLHSTTTLNVELIVENEGMTALSFIIECDDV